MYNVVERKLLRTLEHWEIYVLKQNIKYTITTHKRSGKEKVGGILMTS